MKQHREGTILLGIFLLALLIRVLLLWPLLTAERELKTDEPSYHGLAVSLVETGRLEFKEHGTTFRAYRMPFFPLVLASIYYVLGPDPYVAQPFIVVLSALTCAGTYILGRELFDRRVGLIAGVLTSFDPALIAYSRLLFTETLSVFLVLCAMIALERLRKNGRWTWAVASGMFLGLATLTRANFGPFVPFALGWLVFTGRSSLWPSLRNAAIIAALTGSLWTGWVARNYIVFGEFIPFTTQGGNAYNGIYNDVVAARSGLNHGEWDELSELSALSPAGDWTEIEADRVRKDSAFAWIRAHPGSAATIALMQVVHLWRPQFFGTFYVLLMVTSLFGFLWAVRRNNQGVILWAILAGVYTFMALMTLGRPRFRLPLHPILAVLAGAALLAGWQIIVARWGPNKEGSLRGDTIAQHEHGT